MLETTKELFSKIEETFKQTETSCWVFLGKKIFDQEQKVNRRNGRVLWLDPLKISKVMHIKFPEIVFIQGILALKDI